MLNKKQLTLTHTANIAYPSDPEYGILREFIQKKYFKTYNAKTNPNPDLFVYTNFAKDINHFSGACFGLTFAKDKKLFSERYLDQPVEEVLKENFQADIQRNNIAELGSLISFNAIGEGNFLIRSLPSILEFFKLGALLITSTEQLTNIYEKKGIKYHKISAATKNKLGNDTLNDWGTYYNTNPVAGVVLAQEHGYSAPINEEMIEQNISAINSN